MKHKLFGFMSKLVEKHKLKQSQQSVMKYVDILDKTTGDEYFTTTCPYCLIKKSKMKNQEDADRVKIFTCTSPIDFVEHCTKEHGMDPQLSRAMYEMMYLSNATEGLL